MSTAFTISGIVREKETGIGVGNLMVKAYDKDLIYDDLMGNAFTKSDGTFNIVSEAEDFRDFFDRRPDIYLRVMTYDGKREIFSTENSVRWEAGHFEYFEVDIPRKLLGDIAPQFELKLTDEIGEPKKDYDVGESLILEAKGLLPSHIYDISISDKEGNIVISSRLITDRDGDIPSNVLWAQMGLGDINKLYSYATYREAARALAGKEFTLKISDQKKIIADIPIRLADKFQRKILYSSDSKARLRNGFEVGKTEVYVTGCNFSPGSIIRVFMVKRQFGWNVGDPIEPVIFKTGRKAIVTIRLDNAQTDYTIHVADPEEIEPGSYDFIARPYREGFYNSNEMRLQKEDIVSSKLLTSLVIRSNFYATKTVFTGCANAQDMAGRPIVGKPYFKFTDNFPVGTDVWAALDPAGLDPSLIGKKVAIYVIQHKTTSQWSADNSLQHLPVLGGNAAVQEFIVQSDCINYNKKLVWSNPQTLGKYDIIADFGNNPAQISNFVKDDQFNQPLDIIDGYFKAGFQIIADPTTTQSFTFIGSFEYNEGTIDVPASGEFPNPHPLEQKAIVYFPSAFAGATNPSDISSVQAKYPLVVIVHGNSSNTNSYKGYNYLLEHLARNGFIAASIHIYSGAYMESRARALFKHIEILKTKFPGKIDLNKIGIMGHSRGGEAVVLASKLNVDESLGYNFGAIISLAPTDWYHYSLAGAYKVPYLVVYGSNDGDVAGGNKTSVNPKSTGFSLYDRADPDKSMLFVYGATHGRFNDEWGDTDITASWSKVHTNDLPKLISADAHRKIAKGFMNAFFQIYLYGKTEFIDYFTGELIPPEVEIADGGNVKIHAQYQSSGGRILDNFNNANWQINDLGGNVTHTGLPTTPQEGDLSNLDSYSPHDTNGGLLKWDTTNDIYLSSVPAIHKDISAYKTFSFRITQRYGSSSNPVNSIQDLYVKLTDNSMPVNKSRSIKVSKFIDIPYPYVRGYEHLTKSAMKTVRIPLSVFHIQVLNTDIVDLTNIKSIAFEFMAKPTGEIEIDDIEFSS
ncbi:MAG: alpha/beta hydrolase family protein [bacterium]